MRLSIVSTLSPIVTEDSPLKRSICLAVLSTATLLAIPAAHADEDRFTLRLGGMHAEGESQLSGAAFFGGDTYAFESDRYDLGSETVPRAEGAFRFGDRHRLLFNYVRYDKENTAMLREDVTFDGTTFPAGSRAELDTTFDLGSAVYDFGVVETPTFGIGLQIGAQTAGLRGRLRAESGAEEFSARASERGTAPVVGARISAQTAEGTWRFVAQGQYLDADWGDFGDYDGVISRANVLVEYRFTPKFGLYAGYDWFKIDVRRTGEDGRIGLDQRFHGPIAGVTIAF
jgi:hypothetical protein